MARPGLMVHPKFRRLVRLLGVSEAAARGHLELLWETAYQNGEEVIGDVIDVELAARWGGDHGALCDALMLAGGVDRSGFIDRLDDGRYAIHDLFDHAPDYVRKRRSRENDRREKGRRLSGRSEQPTGQSLPNGGHGSVSDRTDSAADRSVTGQSPVSDRSLTTPCAPAPAPAPALTSKDPAPAGADPTGGEPDSESEPAEPKRQRRQPPTYPPELLAAIPDLPELWARRMATPRNKPSSAAEQEQLHRAAGWLATYGAAAVRQAIEDAAAGGWQGLFEPKAKSPPPYLRGSPHRTPAGQLAPARRGNPDEDYDSVIVQT